MATATKKKPRTAFDSIHPLAECWPWMTDARLAELTDNIKARGLDDPIVLHGRVLIDGRNREKACRMAGVKPTFTQWKPRTKGDTVEAFIDARNDKRRHLDESQRALVAERRARVKAGLSPIGETPSGADNAGLTAARTEAAEKMGVARRSVERAAVVVEHGSAALVKSVESGEVAVSAAAEVAMLPKSEQTALVREGKGAVAEKAKEVREEKREARAQAKQDAERDEPDAPLSTKQLAAKQRQWKGVGLAVNNLEEKLKEAGFLRDKGNVCAQAEVDEAARVGKPVVSKPQVYAATLARVSNSLAMLADATAKHYR